MGPLRAMDQLPLLLHCSLYSKRPVRGSLYISVLLSSVIVFITGTKIEGIPELYGDINHSDVVGLFGEEKLPDNHKQPHDKNEPAKAFFKRSGADFFRKTAADKQACSRKNCERNQQ